MVNHTICGLPMDSPSPTRRTHQKTQRHLGGTPGIGRFGSSTQVEVGKAMDPVDILIPRRVNHKALKYLKIFVGIDSSMTGDDCSYIPLMNHGSSYVHQLRERSGPLPSLLFIRYFFHSSWNISETLVEHPHG